MNVSIIIVSWNVREHLQRCIESIIEQTKGVSYEIIVVDNASNDGSVEMIQRNYPRVTLLAQTTNLGFGTANNRGAEVATGDVLLFLNDDTILHTDAVTDLYRIVSQRTEMGVVGCHMTNLDGTHQDSVRRFPTWRDQLLIVLKLHNLFPNIHSLQHYFAQDLTYSTEQVVDQVMGAAMALRRDVFEKSGGFDETFFVWFEEVDLQKRIVEELQLSTLYVPKPEITHIKGASFSQVLSITSQRRLNRSMRHYAKKHWSVPARIIITLVQPIGILAAAVVQLMQSLGFNTRRLKHGND